MLLRRIIQHVKTQNWTAVSLDFVIVVVGVFIGIQVSNWNDSRANEGIVARHLGEIAEDLEAHLEFHDLLYGSATARIAAADYLLKEARNEPPLKELKLAVGVFDAPETQAIPEQDLNNLLGWLNIVRITVSARNGYESLISSGNLGLIENRELARSIQQYYGQYDDLLDTQIIFREFRRDGVQLGYKYGLSALEVRPASEIVNIVKEHHDFAAYVRSVREWAFAHAQMLEDLRIETEELLQAIESELGAG